MTLPETIITNKPTGKMRWVKYTCINIDKAKAPVFGGEVIGRRNSETGYILQQEYIDVDGVETWRNVEIEYFPQ